MAETDNFYSSEDDSLYGVTGSTIVSAFSLAAQKERVKIEQAKREALEAEKQEAKDKQNALLIGTGLYKASGAYDKKQRRIAEALAKENEFASVDESSWNPFKSGKDRIKLNKDFKDLDVYGKSDALDKMKELDPELYEAVGGDRRALYGADLDSIRGKTLEKSLMEKYQSEGWTKDESATLIEGVKMEADPDYRASGLDGRDELFLAKETQVDGYDTPEIDPNLTQEDIEFSKMLDDELNAMETDIYKDSPLPEAIPTEESINLAKYQADTEIYHAASDAGYESVEFYQRDLKQMKADGYDDLDLWHEDKIKEEEALLKGVTADANIESESVIVDEILQERDPALNNDFIGPPAPPASLDKSNVGINNPAADVATDIVEDTDVSMFDSKSFDKGMNAISTTSSVLNLADSVGIINMDDRTEKFVDTAGTVAQAAKTVNAVKSGTMVAATGMGKVMPAVGVVTGAMSAFDSDADTDDRVRGAMTAVGSAMMLTPLAPVGALLTVGSSLWSLFD